jgi:hypothetical protein
VRPLGRSEGAVAPLPDDALKIVMRGAGQGRHRQRRLTSYSTGTAKQVEKQQT